jgi:citrate lyase subunit beta/citryl-CoA lyase
VAAIAWLYVPASKLDTLLSKAATTADGVVIDLEDAVHPDQRPMARALVEEHLGPLDIPVDIRINPVDSEDFDADVALVHRVAARVAGVRLTKVESADDTQRAISALAGAFDGPFLVCQLESALGVIQAHEIARLRGVQSIMLGESDLRADLGVRRDDDAGLTLARQTVVLASRAAGLTAPIGSVFANVADQEGLLRSTELLRSYGFLGRSCIHPRQVDVVRRVFAPSSDEVAWAREVMQASETMTRDSQGAAKLEDGSFIDPAIERQARDILTRAGVHA